MLILKPGSYTGTIIERDEVDLIFFHANSILGLNSYNGKGIYKNYFSFQTCAMKLVQ